MSVAPQKASGRVDRHADTGATRMANMTWQATQPSPERDQKRRASTSYVTSAPIASGHSPTHRPWDRGMNRPYPTYSATSRTRRTGGVDDYAETDLTEDYDDYAGYDADADDDDIYEYVEPL